MQRLLIVEDHASSRQTLALLFDLQTDFEVVAQAGSLGEADCEGVDLIEELCEANPEFAALVLTASLDRGEHARAIEAGAAGVLHKSADVDEIMDAARCLAAGETLISAD